MKKLHKGLALLLAGTLALTGLAGCGAQSGTQDVQNAAVSDAGGEAAGTDGAPVTITFWIDNTTDEREAGYRELIEQFEADNPDIKVDLLGVAGNMTQKLDVALAGGTPPDCSTLVQDSLASYILNGKLAPLDDYLAQWDAIDEILPSAWETVGSFNAVDDTRYALPFATNLWCLWVNKEMYESKDLPLPEDWEKFFTATEALYDPDSNTYGVAIRGGAGGGTSLEYMMYAYSGLTEFFDADGRCTINDPKNVEFVERYLGLYGDYTAESDINNGWTELAAAFQSGSAATVMHNLGSANAHAEVFNNDYSKFEAMPLPSCAAGYRVYPQLNISGYCIYADSQKKDAAWRFISWLSEGAQAAAISRVYGIVPVNAVALQDDFFTEYPWFQMATETLNDPDTRFYDSPFTYPEYGSIVTTYVEPMIQQCMAGEITAQELCDSWAELMDQMKAEFDQQFAS